MEISYNYPSKESQAKKRVRRVANEFCLDSSKWHLQYQKVSILELSLTGTGQ